MAGETEAGNKWESEAGQMAGVVFAYITHYIFMNTKELNEYFMDKTGRRLKRIKLFGQGVDTKSSKTSTVTILNISRQRYVRMCSLEGGYHISKKDRDTWEKRLNIDMNYFYMGDGKKVLGCSFEEWKKYFEGLHCKNAKPQELSNEEKMERAKKIKEWERLPVIKSLQEMMANIDMYLGTPIYSIHYYIKYNERYIAKNNLQAAMELLDKVHIREWENITAEDSERYREILRKHYEYIRMKIAIQQIEALD